jgi:hypothetical protein
MKLKNMKAQNKKLKLSNSLEEEQVEDDQIEQLNDNEEVQETVEQKVRHYFISVSSVSISIS